MTDVLVAGSRVAGSRDAGSRDAGSRAAGERADAETRPLLDALEARGLTAAAHPWDDPDVDWGAARLVVVRTTWDYTARLDEFLGWARDVAGATGLQNPLDVLAWNSHKRYLTDLAGAGVPVVPTVVVPRAATADQREAALASAPGPLVVKPAVGAGGRGAALGGAGELADPLAALVEGGDALVQPAVESVRREGEVSLIRLGDRWSHAVRKVPASGGFLVHERHGGRLENHTPTAPELVVADAALARAPAPVSAARVDLVRLGGGPVVMELELIEPELFLRRDAHAATRLADALVSTLG